MNTNILIKLVIIGGGKMGSIFLNKIADKIIPGKEILLIEPDLGRQKLIQKKTNCNFSSQLDAKIKKAKIFILAIKPQISKSVISKLNHILDDKKLIISIMAGITINDLKLGMGNHRFIRAMPNSPIKISQGLTVFYPTTNLKKKDYVFIDKLFSTFGEAIKVDSEDLINSATAISGSGPAYFFLLAELMIDVSQKLGFKINEANQLVKQTLKGSALLLDSKNSVATELKNEIISKGGTTEAALKEFKEANLEKIIIKGILKAYNRANELSRNI